MSNIISIIIMLLKTGVGKDVAEHFANGKKPAILSRRFVGSMVTVLGAVAMIFSVEIPKELLDQITNNIMSIASAVTALWGVVLSIVGMFKAKKES